MMKLWQAGRVVLLDMAATLFFLALYLLTDNVFISFGLGVALGLSQIGWKLARSTQIGTLEWVSLVLLITSGAATILTRDPRFVMVKSSLIYVVTGTVMLKPGWMMRYLPPKAVLLVPDIANIFGFVWAGLLFFTAIFNIAVALEFSVAAWAVTMPVFTLGSELGLFLIQYAVMHKIAWRRFHAGQATGEDMLPQLPG
jgi:intracellular septation protein